MGLDLVHSKGNQCVISVHWQSHYSDNMLMPAGGNLFN